MENYDENRPEGFTSEKEVEKEEAVKEKEEDAVKTVEEVKEKCESVCIEKDEKSSKIKDILLSITITFFCLLFVFMINEVRRCNASSKPNHNNVIITNNTDNKKDIVSLSVKPVEMINVHDEKTINISEIARNVTPSLVEIKELAQPHEPGFKGVNEDGSVWNESEELLGNASGVIFASDENEILILTNAHVVEKAKAILVKFCNGEQIVAYLKGYVDQTTDIAVIAVKISDIKFETLDVISCIRFGNSDNLIVGDNVVAIGNALGYGQSVTAGIVSALNRTAHSDGYVLQNSIQISAGISPGNSGGALVNAKGELVGVTTAKPTNNLSEGVGFAIPINDLKENLEILSAKKSKMYSTDENKTEVGVNVSDTYLGVMVVSITKDSPAYQSDLQVGDIVKTMNGEQVTTVESLIYKIRYCSKGDTVTFIVERPNGKEYKPVTVTIKLS